MSGSASTASALDGPKKLAYWWQRVGAGGYMYLACQFGLVTRERQRPVPSTRFRTVRTITCTSSTNRWCRM
jgi:hypothetical protein